MFEKDHVKDQLPAYALGCLDSEESIQVGEHLAVCESCQQELQAYYAVTDRLGLSAPEVDPPAHLKIAVMNQVAQAHPTARPEQPAAPGWLDRFMGFFARRPAWAALAGIILLLLFTSNLLLLSQVNRLQAELNSSLQTVQLQSDPVVPQATGVVVLSMNGAYGTLVVDGLPPLDASHQYQLWLIKDGQRSSGGVFSVDEDGYGALWIYSHDPLSTYNAVGVTIEPFGGSPGPTGERVLGGSLDL